LNAASTIAPLKKMIDKSYIEDGRLGNGRKEIPLQARFMRSVIFCKRDLSHFQPAAVAIHFASAIDLRR